MKPLEKYRNQIDTIDHEILKLLSIRLRISKKIGNFKKTNGLKIVDKTREKVLLENILKKCSCLKLDRKFIKGIYLFILDNSRKNQK